jgi:hypothetical protein
MAFVRAWVDEDVLREDARLTGDRVTPADADGIECEQVLCMIRRPGLEATPLWLASEDAARVFAGRSVKPMLLHHPSDLKLPDDRGRRVRIAVAILLVVLFLVVGLVVLLVARSASAQTSKKRAIVGDANAIQACELYVALADRMEEAGHRGQRRGRVARAIHSRLRAGQCGARYPRQRGGHPRRPLHELQPADEEAAPPPGQMPLL